MYSKFYNKLFWGLFFITFHINLGMISLLPNFIGYIMIYEALGELSTQNITYNSARKPAIILIFLSLFECIEQFIGEFSQNNTFFHHLVNIVLDILGPITLLYLMYTICKAIHELCEQRQLEALKKMQLKTWKFYAVISVIYIFSVPFFININLADNSAFSSANQNILSSAGLSQGSSIIIALIAVANIIANICMLVLFKKCRTEIK